MSENKGYGSHPTIFQNHSDQQIALLFHQSIWTGLNEETRQQALQEVVNRAAAAQGQIGSSEVRFANMDSSVHGTCSNGVIQLNRAVFAEDKYITSFQGKEITEKALDSNFKALETVLHENDHAWQDQVNNGTIQISDQEKAREYKSNCFTTTLVPDEKGQLQPGSHYLEGNTNPAGYLVYYFQSTEQDAHRNSQQITENLTRTFETFFGKDESIEAYRTYLQQEGYNTLHEQGAKLFGNENFEKEINQTLMNAYYGTSVFVDPKIEQAVHQEMIASYISQHPYLSVQSGNTQDPAMQNGRGLWNQTSYSTAEQVWQTNQDALNTDIGYSTQLENQDLFMHESIHQNMDEMNTDLGYSTQLECQDLFMHESIHQNMDEMNTGLFENLSEYSGSGLADNISGITSDGDYSSFSGGSSAEQEASQGNDMGME